MQSSPGNISRLGLFGFGGRMARLCLPLCLALLFLGSGLRATAGANPHWLTDGPTFFSDGSEQLVWYGIDSNANPTYQYVIWDLSSNGKQLTSTPVFGPRTGWNLIYGDQYDGSSSFTLADGSYFLIWASSDQSQLILWKMDSTHHYVSSSQVLSAATGWRYDQLYQAPDGSLHLIWQHYNSTTFTYDEYVFWTINTTGNFVSSTNLLAVGTGWTSYGPEENSDGTWYILWRGVASNFTPNYHYVFWTLDTAGNYVSTTKLLAAGTGWTTNGPRQRYNGTANMPWAIFWSAVDTNGKPTGRYVIWNLDAKGNFVSSSQALQAGGSWRTTQPEFDYNDLTKQYLIWHSTDSNGNSTYQYLIWTLDGNGNEVNTSLPLAAGSGWISDGPQQKYFGNSSTNAGYILWRSVDTNGLETHQYVFWNLNATGNLVSSSARQAAGTGWTTDGPQMFFTDGTWRIVWSAVDTGGSATGKYVIWNLDANGNFTYSTPAFGPRTGWGLFGYGYDGASVTLADGSSFLIWTSSDQSQAILWKMDSQHRYVSASQVLSAATGWQFDQLYQSPNGSLHILWQGFDSGTFEPTDKYIFWTINTTGNFLSSSNLLAAGPGWTTSHGYNFVPGPYEKADGTWQLFWTGLDPSNTSGYTGQYVFWELDNAGNLTTNSSYGPY